MEISGGVKCQLLSCLPSSPIQVSPPDGPGPLRLQGGRCVRDLLGPQEISSELSRRFLKVFSSYSFHFLLSSFRIAL